MSIKLINKVVNSLLPPVLKPSASQRAEKWAHMAPALCLGPLGPESGSHLAGSETPLYRIIWWGLISTKEIHKTDKFRFSDLGRIVIIEVNDPQRMFWETLVPQDVRNFPGEKGAWVARSGIWLLISA